MSRQSMGEHVVGILLGALLLISPWAVDANEIPPVVVNANEGPPAAVKASEPYTSPDKAFRIVPPAGWDVLGEKALGSGRGHGFSFVFFGLPVEQEHPPQIWIRWRRLPDLPREYELTNGRLTDADRVKIRRSMATPQVKLLKEEERMVGSCAGYGLLASNAQGAIPVVMTQITFVCDDLLFIYAFTAPADRAGEYNPVAQACLETFAFLSADQVPYFSWNGGFQIVPPPHWRIVDRRDAGPPNDALLEFHAADGPIGAAELAAARFPHMQIGWQGPGVGRVSSEEIKARMTLGVAGDAKIVREGARRIGPHEAYEWIVQETQDGSRINWSSTAFSAGDRMYFVGFRAPPDTFGQLIPKVRQSLRTFKLLSR